MSDKIRYFICCGNAEGNYEIIKIKKNERKRKNDTGIAEKGV